MGLRIKKKFSNANVRPFWVKRDAVITDHTGKEVFRQNNVEFPESWSQTAVNIVAQKYFRVVNGVRETSVKQMIGRVVTNIYSWGKADGYFASNEDANNFKEELEYLLVNQMMAFNSPVWFNVGVSRYPQTSACFIQHVEDNMSSILDLAKSEGMLFKGGSGSGTNLSPLRSSKEKLSGGGRASGPVSFMRGYDAFAGAIKSGGTTRRAAKLVCLDIDHPDIVEFIECKALEEKKAHALIDAGYDGGFNVPGGAYDSVSFQNANNSVRVSDDFMKACEFDWHWDMFAKDRAIVDTYKAQDLMRKIAQAAWECGDPGLQFDDTINEWHTCPNSGRINASNPCSEYMFLDDTACNLASLNLMKFRQKDGSFDVESFKHAVSITILAQEILVSNSAYPTTQIASNSEKFRPLGLGYANLGALLMCNGLAYDSQDARSLAGAITSLMTAQAYVTSADIAKDQGACEGFKDNKDSFAAVIQNHWKATEDYRGPSFDSIWGEAWSTWADAAELGRSYGYRNSQVTVLAPTGTIAFLMDCDTTGIEPDIALVKYKTLVGGGAIKIVNSKVKTALETLGYKDNLNASILKWIEEHDTIEGCELLNKEHLPIFDCAFRPANGARSISPRGHIEMMAAVQPFLSGAISKTVNLPVTATVEDVENIYYDAYKLGLKAVAIYRDGCKRTQPLNTTKTKTAEPKQESSERLTAKRHRLADERPAITHKFSIGGHEGYVTVGLYPDGRPGEVFVKMAKEGSTISGLMDAFATGISIALQHGVELSTLADKFKGMRFEPSGFTGNMEIPMSSSIMDYLSRWLEFKFSKSSSLPTPEKPVKQETPEQEKAVGQEKANGKNWLTESDAPPCPDCGSLTVRNGSCRKCINCGSTTGCS